MIKQIPHMVYSLPFEWVTWAKHTAISNAPSSIKVKDISFSYGVEEVFQAVIPALHHGNDGLIYTCVETQYIPGTDQNM